MFNLPMESKDAIIEISPKPDVSICSVKTGDNPRRYILGQKAVANVNGNLDQALEVAQMHPSEFTPTLEYLRDSFSTWAKDEVVPGVEDRKRLMHQGQIAIAAVVLRSGDDIRRRVTARQVEIFDEFIQARDEITWKPIHDMPA